MCVYHLLNGYRDAFGAFTCAVALSILFHDLAHSKRSLKLHGVCDRIQKHLYRVLRMGYELALGRKGPWSALFLIDPPVLFFPYWLALFITRKILKVVSRKKMYVEVTPLRVIMTLLLVPLVMLLTITPRLFKESITIVKLATGFIKSRDIPWKRMIEDHLRGLQTSLNNTPHEKMDFSLNDMASWLAPNGTKMYHKAGLVACFKALKDDAQAIISYIQNNAAMKKHLMHYAPILMGWMHKEIKLLRQCFVFLTTFCTFMLAPRNLLWYVEEIIKPVDGSYTIGRNVRKSIQAIVYGGVIKFTANFGLLYALGSLLSLPLYASCALICALLCLFSTPIHHVGLLCLLAYLAWDRSIVTALLSAIAYLSCKRMIRKWAHEREYRFPLATVLIGFTKFGLAGIFLWPISMSLLNEVFSLLIHQ